MNRVFISLGSNLGNRSANLQKSIDLIEEKAGKVSLTSSLYETEPWQMASQTKNFVNRVILIETSMGAEYLLDTLLDIERQLGRLRNSANTLYESRIIDLDILFYNEELISTTKINIPHPLLHKRMFVLEPLAELQPNFIHPLFNKSIKTLLSECTDTTVVEKIVSK